MRLTFESFTLGIWDMFGKIIKTFSDPNMVFRLAGLLVKVAHSDMMSERGKRRVWKGDLTKLHGFEFNDNVRLSTIFGARYHLNVNRETGAVAIAIPSFVPGNVITAPAGTTHFRMFSVAIEVDFEHAVFTPRKTDQSTDLPLDNNSCNEIILAHSMMPGNSSSLFVTLGIQFLQVVNGVGYELQGTALRIVGSL